MSTRPDRPSVSRYIADEARLQALRHYQILDTEPEPAYDRVTRLAAHLFDASTAIINLLEDDRQWFKSTVGFDEKETGLDVSFCVYTVEKGDVFVVEDLAEDERFADNPYVAEHGVRFYAGAPLVTPDNHRIGTLCVLDTEPRSPDEEVLNRLSDLAAMVVDELELRRERAEHAQSRELLRQSQRLADVGGVAYDPETNELMWTDETYDIFGLSPGTEVDLETAVDFYTPESRSVIEPEVERLLDEGGEYDLELDVVTANGERRHVRTIAEAQRENDETTQIVGAIQDVTEQHRDRRLKEVQSAFFEWIATGAPTNAVLDEIARFTESELADATVSILRLEDNRLYHTTGPSLPTAYIDAIDGVRIGPDVGTCGAAVHHGREVVTEDIRTDDRWEGYRTVAEQAGFRACNSQVIQGSGGEIFGTFAIYRTEAGSLDSEERQLVKRMSHLASVALEREQRERALRESEERWRRLVDKHPGPIHVTVDGKFVYANKVAAELHGVASGDDLIGQDILDFIPPAETNKLAARRKLVYEEREEAGLTELRIRRADGTDRTVLIRSVPIQYEGKAAAQTMMRDVTERQQAERQLRETNQQLRLLEAAVEHSLLTVLITEADPLDEPGPEVVYANPAFTRVTGYDPDEIVGRSPRFLQGADTDPEALARIRTALENDEPVRETVRNYRKDGTPYWSDLFIAPVWNDDGEVTHYVSIQDDVTEKRRRKRELERQNDLFAKAQAIADVGAWEYNVQSGETLFTEQAYRIQGLEPDAKISPERTIELFHPDDRQTAREAFTRALEEGKSYDIEARLITDEGERRWVRTRGQPQLEEGEVVRIRGVIQDITEQKQAEQNLRRSRERLSMAVEGGNIGTWNWDLETDDVVFNERWAEMLGYSRGELDFHFRTWEELVHPEDLSAAMEELNAYLEGEADGYATEIRMQTKSGDWKWVQTIGKVVERDEEGTVTRFAGIHLDVDDRKRAEQAVQKAKSRYQTLVENFPDGGVFLLDEDLRYLLADGEGLADVGLSPQDFEGSGPHDLFPPDVADEQISHLRRALEGETHTFDQQYEGRHYRLKTLPIRREDGEVVSAMAVVQDVSERKETRQQLERYRDYTSRLINAIDDLFFALDENAQFQRWNDRIPEVTGYTDEEIGSMTAFDLVPDSEEERVAAGIKEGFERGHAQIEVPLVQKDGTAVPYEFVGNLVENPDGELRAVGIGRDVTERKQRKEVLERQNDLFTKAQDIADVGAWEYDLRSGELNWTEQAYRIHGLSPDTAVSPDTAIAFYHPDDQSSIRDAFTRAVEEGEPYDLELRFITTDDEHRWVRTRGEPQHEDGEIVRIRGTIQDVTERLRRREELKAAKEAAEEADRIKTALLSNMNHEFRTPLTSILTFSNLISDNPDVAGRFIERIRGGGRRLLYTLNTVMDFAELETEDRSVTTRTFQLRDVVRSVINDFREEARQKRIDLSIDGLEEIPKVRLDQYRVERILTHLVHNAVKFTEEGTVTVLARKDDGSVEIEVEDTGIGIDPDFQAHVFDEFAQQSSGYDRTHEGNGLGLTIVKRLVEEMQGSIEVESTPGEGTLLRVRLPEKE